MSSRRTDWRKDPEFIAIFSFIVFVATSTCYALLANKIGEDIANFFVDNFSDLYRATMPSMFAMGNPRWMLQAGKFILCLSFNALGLGIGIYAW